MSIHQLHPEGKPLSWQDRLEVAMTEGEVLAVARDFLATVTPYEIAGLPAALRPERIGDANDVTSYAFELVRADFDDGHAMHGVLHRLAHFFSRASIRLSQILASRPSQAGFGEERRA
jgi:hypothetical protein